MKLTNEQIKAILDGAPEGATHYTSTTYLRYDSRSWVWWSEVANDWCFVRDESLGWAQHLGGYHGSLSDLREILTLRQEVERLKAQQSEVAARAVEGFASELKERAKLIPLGAESKSKGAATYNWQMFYAEVAEIYANQLREQCNG